jgi:chemotaxis protein MotA
MDLATIIGIGVGLGCILMTAMAGGNIGGLIEVSSLIVVVGGGVGSTLISYKLQDITGIVSVAMKAFMSKETDAAKTILMLVDLSQKARREGLLALESEQEGLDDEYVKQSLQLVVDGVEPDTIRESMDLELANMKIRHEKGAGVFKVMGAMFPAWGMIGTLIGLVNLLGQLDDPNAIGPAMALALLTTLYGSILANMIALPIASKLEYYSKMEVQQKEMIIEGILSIQAGENPRIMEHKLKTFLSPSQKAGFSTEEGGGSGAEGGEGAEA